MGSTERKLCMNGNQRMNGLKSKQQTTRKIIVAGVCLFLLFIIVHAIRSVGNKNKGTDSSTSLSNYVVHWKGEDCSGTYTGEVKNGVPDGEGVFETQDFSYTGEWENGVFKGKGNLTFSDGSWEDTEFSDGKRNGFSRQYKSQGKYTERVYDSGAPYGDVCTYEDGKLVDHYLLANKEKVRHIEKDAVALDAKVIRKKDYLDQYVYVTGVVKYIFQNDSRCYFRIESERAGMIAGFYENTSGIKSKQAIMPNMKVGEHVTVYGLYSGLIMNTLAQDDEGYMFNFPNIQPVYGKILTDEATESGYALIKKYPYQYLGRSVHQDYLVNSSRREGNYLEVFATPADSDNAAELYVLRITDEDEEAIVYPGDRLDVTGYYIGQSKVMDRSTVKVDLEGNITDTGDIAYTMYPKLKVLSYDVR